MGSAWPILALGLVFLALLLIRVAFLLVLRSGESEKKTNPGPPPRVIKNDPSNTD